MRPQFHREPVQGPLTRGLPQDPAQALVLRDQPSRPAPRERVEGLHEARPDERASAVALLTRPVQRVKLGYEPCDLGRGEEGG